MNKQSTNNLRSKNGDLHQTAWKEGGLFAHCLVPGSINEVSDPVKPQPHVKGSERRWGKNDDVDWIQKQGTYYKDRQ